MKWFFWGICALTLLIVIRTLSDLDDGKAASEYGSTSPAIAKTGSDQELRAENSRLRERITQLDKELAQLKQLASDNNSSQPGAAIPQVASECIEREKIQAALQKNIQEFNNFLGSDDSMDALKTSFANETIDSSWANNYQHELEAFFKNSFTEVFPQYIECRSNRCKVTIPVADQGKFSQLSQELTQVILNNKNGIAKKIVIEPTENDGTLNFYLARNDEVNFLQ